jgi:Flp pilus assembly protein TadD
MAALLTRQYKFTESIAYLEKASAKEPNNPDVLMLTGVLYILDNAPQMARATFINLAPSYPGVEVDEILARFFPK